MSKNIQKINFFKELKEKVIEVCQEYGDQYADVCNEVIEGINSVELKNLIKKNK